MGDAERGFEAGEIEQLPENGIIEFRASVGVKLVGHLIEGAECNESECDF